LTDVFTSWQFSERTPGSYVEDRGSSIVWRFSNAGARELAGEETPDHAWAKRQAAEAQNHVSDVLCERYKLQIYPGRDAFLLCPRHVTRSAAVAAILPAEPSFDSLPAHLSPSIEPAYDFIATLTTDQKCVSHSFPWPL
jgi:trehalose-6-phosphatase